MNKMFHYLRIGILAGLVLVACQSTSTPAPSPSPFITSSPVVLPATETPQLASNALPDLDGREIRVITENAYPPFSFINEAGQPAGYDYDLVGEACQRLNCKPVFTQTSAEVIEAVLAGKGLSEFEVIANGLIITLERVRNVDFSMPYLTLAQQLLVRADEERFSDVDSLKQLNDFRVGIQLGTISADLATQSFGEEHLIEFADYDLIVQALRNHEIDATLIDNVAGQSYLNASPNQLQLLGPGFNVTQLGLAFPKDSPLKDSFNQALTQLKQDGLLDQLFSRWLLTTLAP